MALDNYLALVGTALAMITAIFVGLQVRKMAQAISMAQLQSQHQLCLEVWRQYNATFSDRQELLRKPVAINDLRAQFSTTEEIVSSDEYKKLKRVAGVYVLAGVLVDSGAIEAGRLFGYISAPYELWANHLPVIRHLRANYYPSLWVHWEKLVTSPENPWVSPTNRQLGKP